MNILKRAIFSALPIFLLICDPALASSNRFDLSCTFVQTSGRLSFNGTHTALENRGKSNEYYATDVSEMKYWSLDPQMHSHLLAIPLASYNGNKVGFLNGPRIYFLYNRRTGIARRKLTQDNNTSVQYKGYCQESRFGR